MKRYGIAAVLVGVVVAFVLAGAMFVSSSGEPDGTDGEEQAAGELEGVTWTLVSWSATSALPDVPITFQVRDGMVSGNSACNSYNGPITVNGSDITVGDLMRTMMFCEATAEAETTYVNLLTQVTTWRIEADELVLCVGAEECLRFQHG